MAISPFAFRVSNSNNNTSGTTTAVDTTAAAGTTGAILVIITSLTAVTVSSADITEGGATANTWTNLFTAPSGGSWTVRGFLATNPNTGASHTFSVTKAGAYPAIGVIPISGIKSSSALDVSVGDFFATSTSKTAARAYPGQGNELMVYALGGGVAAVTGPGSLTKQAEAAGDGATKGGISLFTTVQGANANPLTPTFTYASQQGAICTITLRASVPGNLSTRIEAIANGTGGTAAATNLFFERTQPYTAWMAFRKSGNPGAAHPAVIYTTVPSSGGAFPGHELFIGAGGGDGALGKLVVRIISDISTNNFIEVNGSTTVTDDVLRQVIVTYDGSSTAAGIQIYTYDGSTLTTETMTTVRDTLSGSIVGAGQSLQLAFQSGFQFDMSQGGKGSVTRFVLENTNRSSGYITTNASLSAMPPNDANSLGRWACSEGSGTTVADGGAYGYNITLNSASWWGGDAATAPDAPTIGTASIVSSSSASVTFTANANNGSEILDYTVTSSRGAVTATGSASPITITGLSAGTQTFTVKARNIIGTSAASAASNSLNIGASGSAGIGSSGIGSAAISQTTLRTGV